MLVARSASNILRQHMVYWRLRSIRGSRGVVLLGLSRGLVPLRVSRGPVPLRVPRCSVSFGVSRG